MHAQRNLLLCCSSGFSDYHFRRRAVSGMLPSSAVALHAMDFCAGRTFTFKRYGAMTRIIYDVFISHAYEDQNEFAGKLAVELKRRGLKVWYSGFELRMGASIMASVNKALSESKFGVVIISPVYLTKTWAMKELESMFAQEADSKRILPVLHGMSVDTFRQKLPLLADRYAVSSRTGVSHVTDRVMQVIRGQKGKGSKPAKGIGKKKRKKSAPRSAATISNAGVIVLGGKADVVNAAGGNIVIRKSNK
jgi:hypothetical protein